MTKILVLALAGACGTVARYALAGWVHRLSPGGFPYGTLTVNAAGCFAIGLVMELAVERQLFAPDTRIALTVGLLGGFTTFSAFGYETLELVRGGSVTSAAANVAANVLSGLAAVWLGTIAGRLLPL